MEWKTLEHSYTEKTNDWYASAILISGSLIAVEFLMHQLLLVTLTFVATIAIILLAARRPEVITIEIRKNGIRSGDVFYPYHNFDGFAIMEYFGEPRLLLESNRHFLPLIVIHISHEVDLEDLHELMSHYLPEKELHESFFHLLFEKLGF